MYVINSDSDLFIPEYNTNFKNKGMIMNAFETSQHVEDNDLTEKELTEIYLSTSNKIEKLKLQIMHWEATKNIVENKLAKKLSK